MRETALMRAFLAGAVLIPLLIVALLSIRPGGLRRQLRQAARRFKLALLLAGVYLAGGIVLRLLPDRRLYDIGLPLLAAVLAVVFIYLAQERETVR
jgi:hypothetical protein